MSSNLDKQIKDIKQQQIDYTQEGKNKIKKEYEKIMLLILALLSEKYLKYYNTGFKLNKMQVLKEIEKELIRYKKELQKEQRSIINSTLQYIFMDTYNQHNKLLEAYRNINSKKDISEDEINSIINKIFFDKTLEKRITDNTGLIMNKTYKTINDAFKKSEELGNTITDVNKIFTTIAENLNNRLLETEQSRVFTDAQVYSYKNFGIDLVKWCNSLCPNTCNYCTSMNGQVFSIDDEILIPAHSHCQCYWLPIL